MKLMKHFTFFILLCSLANQWAFAQNETNKELVEESYKKAKVVDEKPDSLKYWKLGSTFTTTFTNVGLRNWQGGGQSAVTLGSLFTGFANYKRDKAKWNTFLEMGFGLNKLASGPFRKSDDRIVLTSRYGYELKKSFYATALYDFRSQFAPGYLYDVPVDTNKTGNKLISDFFAPAFMVTSLGAEFKPNDNFFVMFSPVTSKLTFVMNQQLADEGAFGVTPGKNIRNEIGAYMASTAKFKVMENIGFQTNLNLFMNYKTPALIDVFWENFLIMTVNKYVTINFSTSLIYDDDIKFERVGKPGIGPDIQFRHVTAVGLTFKLL
jgi:hypothetical protein